MNINQFPRASTVEYHQLLQMSCVLSWMLFSDACSAHISFPKHLNFRFDWFWGFLEEIRESYHSPKMASLLISSFDGCSVDKRYNRYVLSEEEALRYHLKHESQNFWDKSWCKIDKDVWGRGYTLTCENNEISCCTELITLFELHCIAWVALCSVSCNELCWVQSFLWHCGIGLIKKMQKVGMPLLDP